MTIGTSLSLAALALASTPATADPSATGRIAYSRHGDVFTMAADGSDKVALTSGPGQDFGIKWSPDGTRLAFARCCSVTKPGFSGIFVMNADGTDRHLITSDLRGRVYEVNWSPDGEWLAYSDVLELGPPSYGYRSSLRIVRADGSETTKLTGYRTNNVGAAWSPDGSKISFMSDRDGDIELYLMNPDGTNKTRLTDDPGTDFAHQWSADGARIVWVRESEEFGWSQHIWSMNADGSDQIRLTEGDTLDGPPSWSPDGAYIAFARMGAATDWNEEIWIMDAAGGSARRLATGWGLATWSPDATRLAYSNWNRDIFSIAPSGSDKLRLTTSTLSEDDPTWQPVGAP